MAVKTSKEIAKMIDHSLLHPTLTEAELKAGCDLAKKYDVASCCVKPCHTALANPSWPIRGR
jgi:deoxyribose-phosphate aldolase